MRSSIPPYVTVIFTIGLLACGQGIIEDDAVSNDSLRGNGDSSISARQNGIIDTTRGCGSETFVGRCLNNAVLWCADSVVFREDCTPEGKTCQFDPGPGYFDCGDTPAPDDDPCEGETFVGRCDTHWLIWCEAHRVHKVNCSLIGKVCRFNSKYDFFDCLH